MILAETIGGLSKSAYQRIPFISLAGSPFLLFLWTVDKLMLIPPPPQDVVFTAAIQFGRLRQVRHGFPDRIEDDHEIRHVLPWFLQDEHVHEMGGQPVVYLFGLDRIWCYLTQRLFRQFGADAPISEDRIYLSLEGIVSRPLLELIVSLWRGARFVDVRGQLGVQQQDIGADDELSDSSDSEAE